ncbi:MAG: M50 family metallopeptidase [Bacteroidota bacterium]
MNQDFFRLNPHIMFYLILGGSLLILRMPLIGKYFRTLNTLLHESGHAIAAILTSGEVLKIELGSDTSGSAYTRSGSKLKAMFVSFAGYPAAALFSALMLAFAVNNQPKIVFFILLTVALLNLALFVRNTYGIAWLLTFSALILLIFSVGNNELNYVFTLAVSLISLSETVYSTLIILFLSISRPRKAGDATNLAKISKVPAAIWGLLVSMMVAFIVYYTVFHFFPFPLKPIT